MIPWPSGGGAEAKKDSCMARGGSATLDDRTTRMCSHKHVREASGHLVDVINQRHRRVTPWGRGWVAA